jgi:DNA-directed RNA polymerase subunit RPC12/RpoP
MYVDLPPMKCSKCGSTSNEEFTQKEKYGVRCLDCGHEKITRKITSTNVNEQINYNKIKNVDNEF